MATIATGFLLRQFSDIPEGVLDICVTFLGRPFQRNCQDDFIRFAFAEAFFHELKMWASIPVRLAALLRWRAEDCPPDQVWFMGGEQVRMPGLSMNLKNRGAVFQRLTRSHPSPLTLDPSPR